MKIFSKKSYIFRGILISLHCIKLF